MGKKNQQKLQRSLRNYQPSSKLTLPKNQSESYNKNEDVQIKLSEDSEAKSVQSNNEKSLKQPSFERLGRIIVSSAIIFALFAAIYVLDQKKPFLTDLGDWLYSSLKLNE